MSSEVAPAPVLARGELLPKRRPIDFGRVATCLCRPAWPAATTSAPRPASGVRQSARNRRTVPRSRRA